MILDELSKDIVIKPRKEPFRHVIMENVFKKETYKKLCKDFDDRLKRGFANKFEKGKFWKFSHYDAFCYGIDPVADSTFGDIVYNPEWKKFINGFFMLKLTPNVLAELHHHKIGSASGYIHNDYDISSFVKEPLENGTNPHKNQCVYRGRTPGANHCVRSIALLFYFNNAKWNEGDGGETAFFEGYEDKEPAKKISPNSNKLVAFEVSPDSHHSFLSNKKCTRNSLVMWYHCPEQWAIERYKEKPK